MTGPVSTTERIGSLEWLQLYEAFEVFRARAQKRGLYEDELKRIEEDLFARCPIPQPKQIEV